VGSHGSGLSSSAPAISFALFARIMISAPAGRRGGRAGQARRRHAPPGPGRVPQHQLRHPSHVVPQILEALIPAVEGGLNVPLVYNTGGYDSLETLKLLDGSLTSTCPTSSSGITSGQNGSAMSVITASGPWRPCGRCTGRLGDLEIDEAGVAMRGLLVRHLVMPGGVRAQRGSCGFWPRRFRGIRMSTSWTSTALLEGGERRLDQPEDHPQGIRTGPGRGTPGGLYRLDSRARREGLKVRGKKVG